MQKLIKQIRAYLNISQTEFAKQLNVTFQTVNRWENSRAIPNKLAQSKMFDLCKGKQSPSLTMKRNYIIFHTMDPILAIEDLKEIHNQKR